MQRHAGHEPQIRLVAFVELPELGWVREAPFEPSGPQSPRRGPSTQPGTRGRVRAAGHV